MVLCLPSIKNISQLIQATFELFDGHASQLCFHRMVWLLTAQLSQRFVQGNQGDQRTGRLCGTTSLHGQWCRKHQRTRYRVDRGQHNEHVPHSAFKGQTPDEMYFATGADVPEKLLAAQLLAKQARRESNLARSCSVCRITEPKFVVIEPPTATAIPSNTS